MPDLYKLVVTTAQENKIKAAITGIFVVCVLIAFAWNRYEAREDREWAERSFIFM